MLKMKGVLAVPGEYEKDGKIYKKTAEELRKAAQRFPILPLTFGHTQNSEPPTEDQQIGTVSQKWSEEQQKVLGEYWFWDEKMPAVLRSKYDNGKKIPISMWYLADSMDEDGTLRGMSYSHVAAVEGEDPVCPIDQCGAFVVAESKGRLVFIEQITDLEPSPPDKKPEKETEASPEETEAETPEEEPEQPKPEPPAEENPEETSEEAPEEEVRLEPEVVIPVEVPVVQKPYEIIDGNYVFVPEIFKQKQEKK